jgi:serine/threonine-protein kinase
MPTSSPSGGNTPHVASGGGNTPPAEGLGELAAGTIVADRYRVIEMLGEGGMGAVYRAEHIHMRKQMALKVLHASMSATAEVVARFEREAIAAGHITHPNVVSASDFGKLPDGSFFLVLELVDGKSLRKLLTELQTSQVRIEPMRAVKIVQQMAAALGAAHGKGVVHRDLKPENVMLVDLDDGSGALSECVKVLDFGIAKVDVDAVSAGNVGASGSGAGAAPLTRMGAVFGTPDYMSPEQAMGQPVDARSDLYSIGIIFYELLTGERPFRGGVVTVLRQHVLDDVPPLPLEVVAQLDPRVLGVLMRLLAKTPDTRLTTADELYAILGDVIARPELPPPTVVDPQPFGTMATMMAGPAIGMPTSPTAIVGMPAVVSPIPSSVQPHLPPITSITSGTLGTSNATKRPWALLAGLAIAALLGLVLVGVVLRSLLSKPDSDASNPAASSSAKAAATIDLPPPPPPGGTSTTASTTGSASGTGGGTADEDHPAAGTTASTSGRSTKDSKASKPKGRKTGPFGIYIPPPKEW